MVRAAGLVDSDAVENGTPEPGIAAPGISAPDNLTSRPIDASNVRPTIFAEMTGLAMATGALNLGQGFPDDDGPATMLQAALDAIAAGANQYPPGTGVQALREAIANHQYRHYGLELDPDTQVAVTNGATEGIAAAILALAGPGDEVVTLEPFYDSYAAVIAMSGATHRTVSLIPSPDGFRVDTANLAAAFSERTAVVLLNSPHNPTGTVLTDAELEQIAHLAIAHDAVVVTDEVYEHLTYDGVRHRPIATLPQMAQRTLSVSSAGKSFSVTGWKIGWVTGPPELLTAMVSIKQFLTYTGGAPFQGAVAAALNAETHPGPDRTWLTDLACALTARRDLLIEGLQTAGLTTSRPQGSYFVIADVSPLVHKMGVADAGALCRALPEAAGVAAVPVGAFTIDGSVADQTLANSARFTFVKSSAVITAAVDRLVRFAGS